MLFGNGDGSFAAADVHPTGYGPGSVAAADFDRDGNVDLAVGNTGEMGDEVVASVFLGRGDGTFHAPKHVRVGNFNASAEVVASYTGMATGDLDADGRTDLVVVNSTTGELGVLLSTPFGTCMSE